MHRLLAIVAIGLTLSTASAEATQPHNVILFVPDGLRSLMVTPENAPAMSALRDQGAAFPNSHSLFPTFTTPNASAMATGHYLGDTGDFSNTIYTGYPVPGAGNSVTPFLESDPVLGDVDEHFAGDYLDEVTLLKAARDKGFNTATIGKLGPALIFDHTERSGQKTVVVDDQTGTPNGIPLSSWVAERLTAAGLPTAAPTRGDNGKPGNAKTAGTTVANVEQQKYFVDVLTKAVLPKFKQDGKPFVVVYWSRDPDGTQHNQGDSLNQLIPGINGPTSLASIKNADDNLAAIRQSLKEQGLDQTTDIVVTSDHGFSTISKQSRTSSAAQATYADVPAGFLPPGFVAIDLANALDLPLWDPDQNNAAVAAGSHTKFSNGVIGTDPKKPKVVVAANGGSDLVYLPPPIDRTLAAKVIKALMNQDYVSGLFVDDALGKFPGTLSLAAVNLKGSAITPLPAISVNFKSTSSGCPQPELCTVEVADTGLQQGQGMHGSFSRGDTHNFTAAIGPDFKAGYSDPVPVSNADVGKTLAAILKLSVPNHGKLVGRVITEAFPGGKEPSHVAKVLQSAPSAEGYRTILQYQLVGNTRYFDAAGFSGRTVGLE